MRSLLVFMFLLCTGMAYSQTQVPNEFQAGEPAKASEVNENFDALETAIDENAADIQSIQVSSVVWEGSWESGIVYAELSLVEYQGSTYIAAQDTSGVEDPTMDSYWSLFASGGYPTPFEFTGVTAATIAIGGGRYSLLNLCQAEFGENARIARPSEIHNSTVIPAFNGERAWVESPVYEVTSSQIDQNCYSFLTAETASLATYLTPTGLIRTETGPCIGTYPVACSVLQ